jgi:zinc transporter ZupT
MEFKELDNRENATQDAKLKTALSLFQELLNELKKRELPAEIVSLINSGIEEINSSEESDKRLTKLVRKTLSDITRFIEKELKIVTIHHYRNTWLALGMAAFGVPLGVAFGVSFGNMAYLGIGLPLGIAIGIAVGTRMDKKALEEGRQLDVEIKY